MLDFSTPTLGFAFFAGLASFLSPCVFALVPAYVGYLSGRSAAAMGSDEKANSWVTLSHGFAFVIGFSLVFILLGVIVGGLASILNDITALLVKIGGVVVVVFGLHMLGIINIKFLNYDLRPEFSADRKRGYVSSALMGVFFSAGWSACIGPVLGLISTFAVNGGSIAVGVGLFAAYSAGLGIPFLIAATQIGWVTTILRRYGKVMLITEKIMGATLIIVGVLLFIGRYEAIIAQFSSQGAFLSFENAEAEFRAGASMLVGLVISALLGLIPGIIARRKGKNFIDWWFMGSGISLTLMIILFTLGVFNFILPTPV
jgi:cytochrome c-type biogenesis protein